MKFVWTRKPVFGVFTRSEASIIARKYAKGLASRIKIKLFKEEEMISK